MLLKMWSKLENGLLCVFNKVSAKIEHEVNLPGHRWVEWVYILRVALLWGKD